jgi:AbrB family looped-hinge helix DNA binding protein
MEKIIRFGKRNTIHLPKAIVEEIGIKEGDMLVLVYDKEKIELRPLKFQRIRFGKRNTIHLPKAIVEEIGIKEGDMLVLVYDKDKIEL